MSRAQLWKGAHGEWYVVVQFALFALVAFGPRTWSGWPTWTLPDSQIWQVVGGVMLLTGGLLIAAGILWLGANLTAVPYPKDKSALVETGPFRLVRHPMYSGGIFMAIGWAFWVQGWLTIIYAIVLFVFFDYKSRLEEQWLMAKFCDYGDYQKRVRKMIPFIY
jgi:protein-S-isoprenylcysteine O-methyltransferase Ste14